MNLKRIQQLMSALIFTCLLAPWAWADSPQKPGCKWETTGRAIQGETRSLKKEIQKSQDQIRAEKKRLKARAKAAALGVKKARERAQSLQEELAKLRARENKLKKELGSQKQAMDQIQATVKDNAALFLAQSPRYSGFSLEENWIPRMTLLAESQSFPGQEEIEFLFQSLSGALADGGRIQTVPKQVYGLGGGAETLPVSHLGTFQALFARDGQPGYIVMDPERGILEESPHPVAAPQRLLAVIQNKKGSLPLDLSRGKLLKNPPREASFMDRIRQGGVFLIPILVIGFLGVLLILERFYFLCRTPLNGKQALMHPENPRPKSPAERLVHALTQSGIARAEAMENKMEENILSQLPPLERFLQTIKIFAAVAPLLGLLGTVSGIIQTFKVITAHGNANPQLLSIGISEALLTTQVGLMTAIPLLLCHHFLSRRVAALVLDMEYTGMHLISQTIPDNRP